MDRRNLVLDVVALAVYLVAANPALTGIGVHEWVGLGVFAAFFAHVLAHAGWAHDAVRVTLRAPSWGRTGNLALDALALVAFVVCVVSGLLVSGDVLRAFGWYAEGYYFWDPLHAVSAKVLLALVVVHVALHAKWIVGILGRGGRRRGKLDAADAADAAEGR